MSRRDQEIQTTSPFACVASAGSNPYLPDSGVDLMDSNIDLPRLRTLLRSVGVSDAMDAIGSRTHCLPSNINPVGPLAHPVVGFAFPVTTELVDVAPPERYVGVLASLAAIQADEVFIISSLGASDVAIWGELLSTSCGEKGVAGAVCDGPVRDTAQIRDLGFPCFSSGSVPYDVNGRVEVIAHGESIEIGGVAIHHGDLVVGDEDGIAIVPREHISEIVSAALTKADLEAEFLEAMAGGMSIADAYQKYGVL